MPLGHITGESGPYYMPCSLLEGKEVFDNSLYRLRDSFYGSVKPNSPQM